MGQSSLTLDEATSVSNHAKVLRSEITRVDGVRRKCPMMGCQAPFLAANCLSDLEDVLQQHSRDFIHHCQERLSNEQWSTLLNEWQHGASVIVEQLRVRLSFFQFAMGPFGRSPSRCQDCPQSIEVSA